MIIKAASGKKYRFVSQDEIYSYKKTKKAGTDTAYGYLGQYGSHTHRIILTLITLPNNETVVRKITTYCGTHSHSDITLCNYDTAYVTCARCKLN
jgi:hypothetical protein